MIKQKINMKTKFTLVVNELEDWKALYINENLAVEGHNIDIKDMLDCISDILPNEYNRISITESDIPSNLNELDEYKIYKDKK